MMGLFTSFDPFSFNMMILFYCVMLVSFFPYLKKNMKAIKAELIKSLPKSKSLGSLVMIVLLFIMFYNLFSLFPHIFAPTAHIAFTVCLSLTFWLCSITSQFSYFLESLIMHLAPSGTPSALLSFMVLIEMVSQFIRPITLSVRLSANLTAGHLILGLLANSSFFLSVASQLTLLFLEILVAVVQSYVFSLLFTLYYNE